MRRLAALPLLAFLLGACGDDGDPSAVSPQTPEGQPAASASTPTPPEFVETETCRRKMRPLLDIMVANVTDAESNQQLTFLTFEGRVDELERKIDAALAPCSNKVNRPARMVMYRYAIGRVTWDLCESNACMSPVEKHLRVARRATDNLSLALDATG